MALTISVPHYAAKPLPGAAAIRSSPGTQTQTPTLRFLQLWAKTIFSLAQPPAQCPSSRAVEDTAFNPLRIPPTSSSPSVLSLLSFFSPPCPARSPNLPRTHSRLVLTSLASPEIRLPTNPSKGGFFQHPLSREVGRLSSRAFDPLLIVLDVIDSGSARPELMVKVCSA
jgi:hypothetical protein